jgi:hypothetical protein
MKNEAQTARWVSRRCVMTALLIVSSPLSGFAQGDAFSALSGCAETQAAEKRRHNLARAEIAKERVDSGKLVEQGRISCRAVQACIDMVMERHGDRERQLQIKDEEEIARHAKARIDLEQGSCSTGPSVEAVVAPQDSLPFTVRTLNDLSSLATKHLLPDPSNPTPINGTMIGKLLFLQLTPVMRDWLINQLNENTRKINALRANGSRSTAEQAELNQLASYGNALQKSLRELRLAYASTRKELGPGAAAFPYELNVKY